MTSGIMEKRGYPTWDVGVVMKSFAKKYPEYVEKFVKAECAGIDFWINNPAKTAKIIAEELSLDLEDATRMMKGTEMVPLYYDRDRGNYRYASNKLAPVCISLALNNQEQRVLN